MDFDLALASDWFDYKKTSPQELAKTVLSLGFTALELQYRMPEDYWVKLKPFLKKEEIAIVSLHQPFPASSEIKTELLLNSADEDERKLALKYAFQSLEIADEVGAKAVVFHLGEIPLKADYQKVYQLYEQELEETSQYEEIRAAIQEERKEKCQPYLDWALLSLDKLAHIADKYGVQVALENRYHLNEVPDIEEFKLFFKEFAGAPVVYWHDTGHAHHWEQLGFAAPFSYLKTFHDQMFGIHLHDAKGREDHLAPGQGEIDFPKVKGFLKPETIKVLEIHPAVSRGDAQAGLDFLKQVFFKGSSDSKKN